MKKSNSFLWVISCFVLALAILAIIFLPLRSDEAVPSDYSSLNEVSSADRKEPVASEPSTTDDAAAAPTIQPAPSPTDAPTPTPQPTSTPMPTPSPSPSPSPTPTQTPAPTPTEAPSPTPTPSPSPKPTPRPTPVLTKIPTPTPVPYAGTEGTVRIMAVGDVMYHQAVINSGIRSDGTRNYDSHYDHIRGYLNAADVRIANMETLILPEKYGYSGYPQFSTPPEVADALVNAGFNVFTMASNHMFDKGGVGTNALGNAGLKDCVKYWKSRGDALFTGIYENKEDFDTLTIGEYNGIKIAFLNYTDIVNGYYTKEELDSISGDIKLLRSSLYKKEIKKAKELADFVIVLPHWGVEYSLEASARQREIAQDLADCGADLIIGTHPHVPEPLETIIAKDGRKVPCYYSLGNVISNMWRAEATLEIMADITLTRTENGIEITSLRAVPLVNHVFPNSSNYAVFLLEDYTDEIGATHPYQPDVSTQRHVETGWLWDMYYDLYGYDRY